MRYLNENSNITIEGTVIKLEGLQVDYISKDEAPFLISNLSPCYSGLYLKDSPLNEEDAVQLQNCIHRDMKTIHIENCPFNFNTPLKLNQKLKYFTLKNCYAGDSIVFILEGLDSDCLEYLDVSGNYLNPEQKFLFYSFYFQKPSKFERIEQ